MIRKEILKNGLTIVTEQIDYAQSVSMGIWVKTGSRHECEELAGISHFLEHMNFKGTEKRTARDLAEVLECRGGQLNAYTTKEYTNFYCQTVSEDYELAMDVLSDLFLHSVYDPDELEKEKKVVLEEINLYEDSPEDLVIDMLNEICWKNHPLGRPILGYEDQVKSFTSDVLKDYRRKMYTPDQTVLAVVGKFDFDEIIATAEKYFSDYCGTSMREDFIVPSYTKGRIEKEKEVAQEHICIGFPTYSIFDEHYYASVLLNEYIGGGAASVLFQKIREDLALSYSVYSFITAYEDCGMMTVYAGTSPGLGQEVESLCFDELSSIAENGVPVEALDRMKSQINGSMRLSADSLGSRLNRLGRNELFHRRYIPVEEVVEKIREITPEDLSEVAHGVLNADPAIAFLGGKNE
ncbi:MAG: insulinase family protein [Firmicutes bacterium]|nr:insulinase family protein [Bacillota bacterium]